MSRRFVSAAAIGLATLLVGAMVPQGDARAFGFATFSAVVKANGNTARGSGVQSSSRIGKGRYVIRFTRTVKKCAFVASVSGKSGGQASVTRVPDNGKQLRVDTFSKTGERTNLGFVLLVNCV